MKDFMTLSRTRLSLGVLLVAFMVAFMVALSQLGFEESTQVEPKKTESTEGVSNNISMTEKKPMADSSEPVHVNSTDDPSHKNSEGRVVRHQDMLSEEMKQAIRDKLLLHGPMEVIYHPDGHIELPSNGRFTQIPVAVKKADGSIEIKEYSTLSE